MSYHELLLPKLEEFVKCYMSRYDPSHDWEHVHRVRNLALKLAHSVEGKPDFEAVEIAALLHDFNDKKYQESSEAFDVSGYLKSLGYPAELSSLVDRIVDNVSYRKELQYKALGEIDTWREGCIELHIVQDADKLDAMGAFGIMRCAAFSGSRNILLYSSQLDYMPDPKPTKDVVTPREDSCVYHFHEKLLDLKDSMKTKEGIRLAKSRHEFMLQFLEQVDMEFSLRS
ncbi:hypothetical protein K493DRAFT_277254 [Basidiobolus meristosporus CBS 931.73]|uniref:HD/PDEase domain-containing protein n=1 Tax=Basidiobolus meristosporus CBS 931.73 TaxID=1314790 RepID=A0A1Y1YXB5_9FUNG|nr:hypothetical protein K493DRAFT_277254 [Basidiobolus meristosporus CBS 931.73]|eukprot:ORY02524.1 hypothetical protein K493DRAFT_277254 [Basidiobolus meristosporus CBS 931.73]